MKKIDPNGDNYIYIFALERVPYETKDEVNRAAFSINFYPIFYDLSKEEF